MPTISIKIVKIGNAEIISDNFFQQDKVPLHCQTVPSNLLQAFTIQLFQTQSESSYTFALIGPLNIGF